MSINFYGLRRARSILRTTKTAVKGDKDAYSRGWRDALKHADVSILNAIGAEKSPRLKPEVGGEKL